MLLHYGARVDAPSATGRRALHLAAFGGFVDAVDVLLKHQADANAVDADEYTALGYAAHVGHADVSKSQHI